MIKVLVCGGRDYGNYSHDLEPEEFKQQKLKEYKHIQEYLNRFAIDNSEYYTPDDNWLPSDILIISGGAKGVDRAAVDWAVVHWCQFKEFYPDWKTYGKAAGHIRNKQMLDEGQPDLVIAFPGGRGTENMVQQATEKGVKVIRVDRS